MFRLAHIQWPRIPTGHHHQEIYFGSGNQSTERTESRALYGRLTWYCPYFVGIRQKSCVGTEVVQYRLRFDSV